MVIQVKLPNYNFLRYEIDNHIRDYKLLESIYKPLVHKYQNNLKELWYWFNSLTQIQRKHIGIQLAKFGASSDRTLSMQIIPLDEYDCVIEVVAKLIEHQDETTAEYYSYDLFDEDNVDE